MKNDAIILTKGSKYIIKSIEARDKPLVTVGIFKGYAALGGDDAIVIEMDEVHEKMVGKLRVIPAHMIVCIDIVSAVEPEEKKEEESTSRYFG